MKLRRILPFVSAYALAQYQVLKIFKRFDPVRKNTVLDLPHVNVTFKSNGLNLHGNLFGENQKGLVVFAHGLGLNSDDYYGITKGFVQNGYQVLAYDSTGTYRSDGINTVGINQSVVDLRAALDYVMSNNDLDKSNLVLCGHSWGGYAVCAILNEYKKYPIKKVISLAGSNKASELIVDSADGAKKLMIPFVFAYHLVTFKQDFFKSALRGINKSQVPVLLVHGTKDEQIDLNTTSIVSHKDQIKNPHVEYFIMEGYGHNEIFEASHDSKEINPILLDRMLDFLVETSN